MSIDTLIGVIAINFLPSLVAKARRHHNTSAILLLNFICAGIMYLLIGTAVFGVGLILMPLPIIGWFIALVWSATAVRRPLDNYTAADLMTVLNSRENREARAALTGYDAVAAQTSSEVSDHAEPARKLPDGFRRAAVYHGSH